MKAKNIYLLNQDKIQTFTDHEIIDLQIRLSKVIKERKVAIDRVFKALKRMTDKEIMQNKDEILGTLNLLNSKCVDSSDYDMDNNGLSLDATLMFWKDGKEYEEILDKVAVMVGYY